MSEIQELLNSNQIPKEDSLEDTKGIKKTTTMPTNQQSSSQEPKLKKQVKKMMTTIGVTKAMKGKGAPSSTFVVNNEIAKVITKFNKEWELQDRKEPSTEETKEIVA